MPDAAEAERLYDVGHRLSLRAIELVQSGEPAERERGNALYLHAQAWTDLARATEAGTDKTFDFFRL